MTSPPNSAGNDQRLRSWQQWVEPWYSAYAVLGATAGGLVPILVPITVNRAHGATEVGLVMAALSLGGLTAPLWGAPADYYRLHRWFLAGGLLVTAIGLTAFALTTVPVVWLGLALLQGIGAAAVGTVANLFVVEAHPQVEWDERIGWLQTFYGGGQVGEAAPGDGRLSAALNQLLPEAEPRDRQWAYDMRRCRVFRGMLPDLAPRPPAELPATARRHLAECPVCKRTLAVARVTRSLVAVFAEAMEPPDAFAARVLRALPVTRIATPVDPWRPAWMSLPALAAVVVALFLLPAPSLESDLQGLLPLCDLSAGEQFVLGGNALSPDLVLAAVLEDDAP